ncbi:SURF1 family protein [Granulicoccus sp. GXG6511]|uniref:SURF1 family protein n=1 Tax=Granulicoccus sp. GXG6511 TaxID=3381351 RepID=UPI003D7ED0C8
MNKRRQQLVIWSLGLLVTAVMLGLGLWQMESFQNQGQQALIERMHEPAVPLAEAAPVGQMPADGYGRTVEARGEFLAAQQLTVPVHGDATQHRVLTAFQLPDGSVVPVERGIAQGAPAAPPSGETSVRGVLLPSEGEPGSELPEGQIGSVRLPRIAQLWDQPLVPGFVVLDAELARAQGLTPAEVTLPSNAGHARNQGYALQWWIFAAAAVAATVKLSRDAAKGTGFMASGQQSVEEPGDNVDNSAQLSTDDAVRTMKTGLEDRTTVDKPPVA